MERKHDGYNTSPKEYHASPSKVSLIGALPAGDGSHSTDQPEGKDQGQVRLEVWSSKLVPETGFNSKAEYTNTQQDITVNGYT